MLNRIQEFLDSMSVCAVELETIIANEQQAVQLFDGDALIELMEQRVAVHTELAGLEESLKALMADAEVPDGMTLEAFIDLYAGAEAPRFQALRRELYGRLRDIEKGNVDSRIRMHAAYDVTNHVLQHLGVLERKQTYGPSK